MEISNSSFTGNHTGNYGGAISNTLQATSDSMHDMLLNITNTTFDGNYSGSGGGAINNAGGSHNVGSGTDAIFSNTINIYEGTKFTNTMLQVLVPEVQSETHQEILPALIQTV